jgi:hypothetical protein
MSDADPSRLNAQTQLQTPTHLHSLFQGARADHVSTRRCLSAFRSIGHWERAVRGMLVDVFKEVKRRAELPHEQHTLMPPPKQQSAYAGKDWNPFLKGVQSKRLRKVFEGAPDALVPPWLCNDGTIPSPSVVAPFLKKVRCSMPVRARSVWLCLVTAAID